MAAQSIPIVPGFHPDPSICRVGEYYYLVNSSFEYLPGVPLRRSTDLIAWELLGNVLDRPEQIPGTRTGGGIFAPTIRHHDGLFWMVTTDVGRIGSGQLIVHAADPSGPWSDPVFCAGTVGIDPDLAWNESGTCYLTWAVVAEGPRIMQARVDPFHGALLSTPSIIWRGTGLAHTEGPHLYRRGDWWYLLAAEGGTERGHAISVARSRSIDGPFTSFPGNPIFSHRSVSDPVQNIGHGDLVDSADGEWALVYLGVRPRGVTPGFHVNGRETFIAGVNWVDDWPLVDEQRHTVVGRPGSFRDDFTDRALHPRWISPEGWAGEFVTVLPGGGLQLAAAGDYGPGVLSARVTDLEWDLDLDLVSGDVSLLLRIDDAHGLRVTAEGDRISASLGIVGGRHRLGAAARPEGPLSLRLRSRSHRDEGVGVRTGPDELEAGFVDADGFEVLARVDGRYLSTEVAGGFTGRTVGMEAGATPSRVSRVTYRARGAESGTADLPELAVSVPSA